MENIINFSDFAKKKSLTDDEIKSLFLGLVNLIKSNAIDDFSAKIKDEFKQSSMKLNSTLLELKVKDEIILDLKKENQTLKSKTNDLINKINQLTKLVDLNKM
ncbi:MAG: hypothetical protein ACI4TI_03505 [Christensenellales bacterium]